MDICDISYKLFKYCISTKITIKDIFFIIRNCTLILLVLILFNNNAFNFKLFHMTLNTFY